MVVVVAAAEEEVVVAEEEEVVEVVFREDGGNGVTAVWPWRRRGVDACVDTLTVHSSPARYKSDFQFFFWKYQGPSKWMVLSSKFQVHGTSTRTCINNRAAAVAPYFFQS